jgi:peptidoglycan/LPS O-acetylase OafA/YrhL
VTQEATAPLQPFDQSSTTDRARTRESATYYPWFDWLRAVLAITVMLGHDNVIGWHKAGSFAVDVFFALSGWLIGGILLKTERAALPRFYFNRAIRIWVPYFLALALLLAASVLHHDVLNAKWWEIVFYKATFVYNLFGTNQLANHVAQMPLQGAGTHFWSINAEEQFYLAAPLLLVLAANRAGRSVLLWCALSVVAWVTNTYSAIVFGVLAAVSAKQFGDFHLRVESRALLFLGGIASAAGIAAGFDFDRLSAICGICIVLLAAVPGTRRAVGEVAGGMSYQLYLNHWIGVFVGHALFTRFGLRDAPERQAFAAVFDIGLAVGLYWFIDRRLHVIRARWATPARERFAIIAGYGLVLTGCALGGFLAYR